MGSDAESSARNQNSVCYDHREYERSSAVKGGFAAAGMGDLSDDEILAKLKENTAEVYAEVLGYMYPEMTPEQYKKVVIKVYCYGPNKNYSFTFDVVETGKFAYVADSLTEL
ncbi:MAG: hypothetical protein IIX38_05010 [Alistipes sp.]|nr:hypothetical protein [Alistipes sp.]